MTKIVPLLVALSRSQNPLSPFKPAVLSRSFSLTNLLAEERPRILAQFAIGNFFIAEICAGRLTGDKLSWRRTKFKIVAFLLHLLSSSNFRYAALGEEIQKLIRI